MASYRVGVGRGCHGTSRCELLAARALGSLGQVAVRWGTRGALHVILSITVVALLFLPLSSRRRPRDRRTLSGLVPSAVCLLLGGGMRHQPGSGDTCAPQARLPAATPRYNEREDNEQWNVGTTPDSHPHVCAHDLPTGARGAPVYDQHRRNAVSRPLR